LLWTAIVLLVDKKRKHRATVCYPMFSGGEKKSFYELSVLVIGTGIIALELKINRFNS